MANPRGGAQIKQKLKGVSILGEIMKKIVVFTGCRLQVSSQRSVALDNTMGLLPP